jgi:hypothetical protein
MEEAHPHDTRQPRPGEPAPATGDFKLWGLFGPFALFGLREGLVSLGQCYTFLCLPLCAWEMSSPSGCRCCGFIAAGGWYLALTSGRPACPQVSIGGDVHSLTPLEAASPYIRVLHQPTVVCGALFVPYRRDHQAVLDAMRAHPHVQAVFAHIDVVRTGASRTLYHLAKICN